MSIPAEWYEYKDLKIRPLDKGVWIPLRAIEDKETDKRFGQLGYRKETFACGSLAIPLAHRTLGDELGWDQIGVGHEVGHYVDEEGYKPVGEYWLNWAQRGPSGIDLVLPQNFGWDDSEWHLNQDVLFALRLRREGDTWVRPNEGFTDVVRLHRDAAGQPTRLDMRAEHLKDYLAARQMALRIAWYRDRDSIIADASHIPWLEQGLTQEKPSFAFKARAYAVHEGSGSPLGAQSAIFRTWRTDVDSGDDVPEFGPETDENTDYESNTYSDHGTTVFRVEGEIWAEEWVEPSKHSARVREDKIPSTTHFIIDAAGSTQSADELNDEDIGKYLWFRPSIIPDLLSRRGCSWGWYTRDTAGIQLTRGYSVHFGVNLQGLITAYAYDIAKLPEWQRRIWQGFNVPPEGGVSEELLAAQMRVDPAGTLAPEAHLSEALDALNGEFNRLFGKPLFRGHPSTADISKNIHRFRSLDESGLYALAKDLVRIIIEQIDVKGLHEIAPPRDASGKGSLKSLERVLATKTSDEEARALLSQLVGVYELRGADAHLPSSELDQAYELAQVMRDVPPVYRGLSLLLAVMRSITRLFQVLRKQDTTAAAGEESLSSNAVDAEPSPETS